MKRLKLNLRGTPNRHDTYIPTGRIWPSGEFSMGYRKIPADDGRPIDRRSEAQRIDDGDYANMGPGWEYHGNGRTTFNPDYEGRVRWCDADAWVPASESGSGKPEPLTLANLNNPHKAESRREKYGLKGITGYGKKMVRSGACLIERVSGKRRTTFCTITMPSLPSGMRRELAMLWPEYLRQLLQFISRRLERDGVPPMICSATEIQPKRLKDGGEAYLHLHLVWPNRRAKAGNWAVSAKELKVWSEKFLSARELLPSGAWVRCNVQPVEKSAAGYLSKYMSKGSSEIAEMAEDLGVDAIPAQWWNMSKACRDAVIGRLRQGDEVGELILGVIDAVFQGAVPYLDAFFSLSECVLEIDGKSRGVGWRGSLVPSMYKDLLSLLDSAAQS